MKIEQFIGLIILIVIGFVSVHHVVYKIPEKTTNKMLKIEHEKVGWIENYKKINKLEKEQIISWLKQYEATHWEIDISNSEEQSYIENTNKISLELAKKVTSENTFILWNPDAEITWVEYSDFNCPFCKRLHDSGTFTEILKIYDWKVNYIYKQYPRIGTLRSEAVLCAWELGGAEQFFEYKAWMFAWSAWDTKESMAKFWSSIGLDESKLLSCIESGDKKDLALAQMKEGQNLFGVTGTPWNVFINNKTGEWTKLPGAYPIEAFKEKIDSLLN